jgi:putative ABC transport system substrate-binding protein
VAAVRLLRWLVVLAATGIIPPAHAQQAAKPLVGFLQSVERDDNVLAAFRAGLKQSGYVEGENVVVDYVPPAATNDEARRQAESLLQRKVAVIVAAGSTNAVVVKDTTRSVPVVFVMGGDPAKLGVVRNLGRPEANITGIVRIAHALASKQLELLHELAPKSADVTVLVNPRNPNTERDVEELLAAARVTGRRLEILKATNRAELTSALSALSRQTGHALLVGTDPLFLNRRNDVVGVAAKYALPAVYPFRQFADAGGLMSYAADLADAYREAGVYVGRVLKGAKPTDLPVQQSSKLQLVINLKTAKSLGLKVPTSLLQRADEVIQ